MQLQSSSVLPTIPPDMAAARFAATRDDREQQQISELERRYPGQIGRWDPSDPTDHPNKPKEPPHPQPYPPPSQGIEYDPQKPGYPHGVPAAPPREEPDHSSSKEKKASGLEAAEKRPITVSRIVTEAAREEDEKDEDEKDEDDDETGDQTD